jgi:glycosyltransferase involved in cell wall biosynthesis
MKISIIIPMKNAMPFVRETVASIQQQTYGDFEAFIVDDGSTDGSAEFARSISDPRFKFLANQGSGCAAGFDTALAQAQGDVLMRCDADDLYPPRRVESQVHWLGAHPDVGAVSGYMDFIWTNGAPLFALTRHEKEPQRINDELARGFVRSSGCAMAYRMDVVRRLKGIRTWFSCCEDIDFLVRLSEVCDVWHVNERVYIARLRENSLSRSTQPELIQWYLDRIQEFREQRAAGRTDDLDRGAAPPIPTWSPQGSSRKPYVGLARACAASMLIGAAWTEMRNHQPRTAMRYALRSIKYHPTAWQTWWNTARVGMKSLRPGGAASAAPIGRK